MFNSYLSRNKQAKFSCLITWNNRKPCFMWCYSWHGNLLCFSGMVLINCQAAEMLGNTATGVSLHKPNCED